MAMLITFAFFALPFLFAGGVNLGTGIMLTLMLVSTYIQVLASRDKLQNWLAVVIFSSAVMGAAAWFLISPESGVFVFGYGISAVMPVTQNTHRPIPAAAYKMRPLFVYGSTALMIAPIIYRISVMFIR